MCIKFSFAVAVFCVKGVSVRFLNIRFIKVSRNLAYSRIITGWIGNTIVLNENELLNDPADYTLIEIEQRLLEGNRFNDFAKRVCQPRIDSLLSLYDKVDVEKLLPGIDVETEAVMLKVDESALMKSYDSVDSIPEILLQKSSLFKMFLAYWAKVHKISLNTVIEDYCSSPKTWETRYSNYNYSLLFKIRKGRGKGGIQKFYAGWNTYLKLANGNIRYLLELIYSAFERHIEDGNDIFMNNDFNVRIEYIKETKKADACGFEDMMKCSGVPFEVVD